jgi:hypothetical protein
MANVVLLRMMLVPSRPAVWRDVELEATAKLRNLRRLIHAAWCWEDENGWAYEVLGCRAEGGYAKLSDLIRAGVTRFRYFPGGRIGLNVELIIALVAPVRRGVTYPRLVACNEACQTGTAEDAPPSQTDSVNRDGARIRGTQTTPNTWVGNEIQDRSG